MTRSRTRRGLLAAAAAAATVLALTGTSGATTAQLSAKGDPKPAQGEKSQREQKGNYDARTANQRTTYARAARVMATESAGAEKFRDSLGRQGIVSIDPNTGTPKQIGRLDGFLTAPSKRPAADIALDYVRNHPAIFKLSASDLGTLKLRKSYTDIIGTRHLSWEQVVDGVAVFGNGLRAHVTKKGELISLQGAPVAGLAKLAAARSGGSALTADQARSTAAKDVDGKAKAASQSRSGGTTKWANGDQAKPVWFYTAAGLRKGWSTFVQAGGDLMYTHVIDAANGNVLYRRNLVQDANGDALVTEYYPGAGHGGRQEVVNLFTRQYLAPGSTRLVGNYVVAFADLNDNDQPDGGEWTKVPGTPTAAEFKLQAFNSTPQCSRNFVCTWDPNQPNSWRQNLNQDVTQGFYLNSVFHDYLKKAPIGFTAAAGNFELKGGDPVVLNSLDGANTNNGLPDANHIDNANMATPPDGISPRMQMYLFHEPGVPDDPFTPTSSSNDASVLYHEYTHGLSNRLVVDASGNSTLNSIQAGAMGEAWSDFYAMDYLVHKGHEKDTAADGEVIEGRYLTQGGLFRTQSMDCSVGSTHENCVSLFGEQGGYTYGDFPTVRGFPQVHSSGEIWAQTMWDIRKRFGHDKTLMLITRAMELSADDPTMLDMRNAVLQADRVAFGGANNRALWSIFAARGMGWFAGAVDAGDAFPAEDFHIVPTGAPGTLSGKVTDKDTGAPVPNTLVFIAGHDSGYTGDYSAVTDAQGNYTIDGVLPGTYPKFVVAGPGYEILNRPVSVSSAGTTANFSPRRDWAAASGGGSVSSFTGPDFTPQCGPQMAIDLSQGTGWGSTTGDDQGTPTNTPIPKNIVVKLPETVNITTFSVDPSATCGDGASAGTAGFRIETSADGTTWATAAEGTFTAANRGKYNDVTPTGNATGVKFVRFWMLSPQVPDIGTNCPNGPFSGCTFMDMTELQVYGTK